MATLTQHHVISTINEEVARWVYDGLRAHYPHLHFSLASHPEHYNKQLVTEWSVRVEGTDMRPDTLAIMRGYQMGVYDSTIFMLREPLDQQKGSSQ